MKKIKVGDIEIVMTDKGVVWSRDEYLFPMKEDEIIPVVNATAELYQAVLNSQVDAKKKER